MKSVTKEKIKDVMFLAINFIYLNIVPHSVNTILWIFCIWIIIIIVDDVTTINLRIVRCCSSE